jgi:hypothetical protein
MAKLYKKVPILVSRYYHHGGDGLERGPIGFFRTIEEYNELSKKNNWGTDKSLHSSWWVRPILIDAQIEQSVYQRWMHQQGKLSLEQVLFSADKNAQVHSVGGW